MMKINIGDTVIVHSNSGDQEIDQLDGMQGSVISVEIEKTKNDGEMWHIWVRVPEMGNELYCLNESEVEAI